MTTQLQAWLETYSTNATLSANSLLAPMRNLLHRITTCREQDSP